MRKTVLISGASIAGPALAYWLAQYGFEPTVVERAPAPRAGGQAIDLRGTAREVAERMGVLPEVRRRHTGVRGMCYVDRDGRRRAEMGTELHGDSGGPIAEIEILRSDLVDILYRAGKDRTEYLFDDTITALTERPDGVHVEFRHAAPRVFDLVVGADGVRSNVRSLAFGPHERYLDNDGHYVAIFAMRSEIDLGGWHQFHAMPARRKGELGRSAALYPVGDNGDARAMFFFSEPDLSYDRRDETAGKRVIAERFAGEGWQVPAMLRAMHADPDFYFARAARVRLDGFSRGRVVLLGDAASAGSIGMGTSLAMVGAYVLAGELAAAGGDHRVAFPAYDEIMRDYVREAQKPMPGGTKAFLPASRFAIAARELFMRALPYLPWRNAIIGGMDKTANMVRLKDYQPLAPTGARSSSASSPPSSDR
ncbi:FAD-dependent monooxygenase [Kutzneria viridogrisea]|uniref:2-polyprenyl-6-methoxyphenol hydroxylase-like FAD-dependent oxidoreductase n=1 Tax=Kutzneria viridogrisea TaxID=47990 RepID=A0ABR6BN12_9PSEU|nr:2-polyprenyl-6-methoxyphenol hydroxylase-like FAD-dependent oxidoreductase [Kutzneria viridogrisea]